MSVSKKFASTMSDKLCDSRINEVQVAQEFLDAHPDAHKRFMNVILSYIYSQAHRYEVGLIPAELFDLIRLCKKIKDYSLHDEFNPVINPDYQGREFFGA
mgnify:CR=1 FL=1